MPTSSFDNLTPILNEVYRLQPERTIELGIGFGKYGVLCRELLDGIYGRCRPDQWQRKISGVEAHEAYRNPAWGCYDPLVIGDFGQMDFAGYDLVMMIDSLEHLEPERGRDFLNNLVANNRHVIVSVPNGKMPQDDPVFGNAYERHLTTYNGPEFDHHSPRLLHLGLCRVVSIQGKQ